MGHFANCRSDNRQSGLHGLMGSEAETFGSGRLDVQMLARQEMAWVSDKARKLDIAETCLPDQRFQAVKLCSGPANREVVIAVGRIGLFKDLERCDQHIKAFHGVKAPETANPQWLPRSPGSG